MNLPALIVAASLLMAAIPASAAGSDQEPREAAGALMTRFMAAWSASDATALASLFAPDADFINPWGTYARGREEIKAFYAGAFASGFAGSKGEGSLIAVRALAPDLIVIDGRWSIAGAKNPDGTSRADEKGILVALIGRHGEDWQILALRENATATDVTPLATSLHSPG